MASLAVHGLFALSRMQQQFQQLHVAGLLAILLGAVLSTVLLSRYNVLQLQSQDAQGSCIVAHLKIQTLSWVSLADTVVLSTTGQCW